MSSDISDFINFCLFMEQQEKAKTDEEEWPDSEEELDYDEEMDECC